MFSGLDGLKDKSFTSNEILAGMIDRSISAPAVFQDLDPSEERLGGISK